METSNHHGRREEIAKEMDEIRSNEGKGEELGF